MINHTSYNRIDLPSKLNYEKIFEVRQFDELNKSKIPFYHAAANARTNYPILETNTASTQLVFDPDTKLAINFQLYISGDDEDMMYDDGYKFVFDEIDPEVIRIPAKLRIGNNYYDGTTWTNNSNTTFNLLINYNKDNLYGNWLNAKDTNNFGFNVPALTGNIVHFDRTVIGDLQLSLYIPSFVYFEVPDGFTGWNCPRFFFIKSITVDAQRVNQNRDKDGKKDTKYENVVNENYINALDDIEFKITSKNDSELSFSKAIENELILDKLTNTIYNSSEKPEKLLIQRIINQYQQPKVKLTQIIKPAIQPYSIITDNYLAGKKFIFTGGTINYEDNSIECNLMELN